MLSKICTLAYFAIGKLRSGGKQLLTYSFGFLLIIMELTPVFSGCILRALHDIIIRCIQNPVNHPKCDSKGIRIHNHLVRKRTLNHLLAKLATWLCCVVSGFLYGVIGYMSLPCHVHVLEWIYTL